MSAGMAEVIAAHQKRGMGMSGGSPDTCKCRVKLYPTDGETYIEERRDKAFAAHVAEELAKAGYGNVQEAKTAALRELAGSPKALERARKRIEDELVEWRDAGRFMLRNNGLTIRNRDSTGSEIIRFGFEDGFRLALETEAQFLTALADPKGRALVQAIHDRKAEG